MENLEGQTFASYEILAKLGQGGMGAVYKARQPLLSRIVALKVMAEQISSDPDYVARFIREAASAANLRHPNIVEVFTAGEQNGMYFMAMEFVEGESLRKRLDRLGRIPPQEAVAVAIYVAQALQHAWNKTKLIHRDIKPDNIFLSTDGEVKVGDLGLAKNVGTENTELTQSGMMMGSPHYISPEQAQAAKDIDFRTDIYSLGCTLYHMLTGKTPYTGDSSMVVIMKHVHEPPPAIFKTWPQCPMPLGMLVGRMLAKDRTARPQSYEQLVAELFAVSEKLQQSAAAPKPVSVTSSAAVTQVLASSTAPTVALQPSTKPKNPKAIYAAAGTAAAVLLTGLLLWSPWKTAPPQDSTTPPLQYSAASSDAALKQLGLVYTNAVGAEMVYIPPGEFMLGSTKEEQAWALANNAAEHRIKSEGDQQRRTTIKQGFWMGRTEVTVGQWKKFVKETGYVTDGEKNGESFVVQGPGNLMMNVKGTNWKNPNFDFKLADAHPVCCVSWNDALAFCRWLTKQERRAGWLPEGRVVRLPTEAEWEYACRAGSQSKCWWGDNLDDGKGRLNWDGKEDGFEHIAPVDSYGARGRNRFGLADMLGNVFEWCLDGYDPTQAHEDFWAGDTHARVLRGGAFDMRHNTCRCARRHSGSPSSSGCTRGFRLVVGVDVLGSAASAAPIASRASQMMRPLFNGKDLTGWKPRDEKNRDSWTVQDGALVNTKPGSHLISEDDFADFELHCEYKVGRDSDGGVFLRGLYQIQISDDANKPPAVGSSGAIIGEVTPRENAAKPAGTWQELNATIVGRKITAILNGKEVLDAVEVTRPSGAALRRDESLPGPIMLEGWKGSVAYRNIRIKPLGINATAASVSGAAAVKQLGSVFTNAVGAELVYIPPGEFMMGSTKEERAWAVANGAQETSVKREGDAPRKAKIKDGFWMGRTEVTVGQWKQFIAATGYRTVAEKKGFADAVPGKRPARGRIEGASWRDPRLGATPQDQHPVSCVSWLDAVAFCDWLTTRERQSGCLPVGFVVRLPTEAEWEYACRAGTQTKFWWGERKEDANDRQNWAEPADGYEFTSPVDSFGARGRNKFGLADMLGNINEWCLDEFDAAQAHEECYQGDPTFRTVRGGSFLLAPGLVRCAGRANHVPDYSNSSFGFRVCVGKAPATANTAGENTINLLPLIDPEKDAVKGQWAIQNGELVVEPKQNTNNPHIEIPYQPPSEYDFRVVFSSQEDTPRIVQVLSHRARAFEWVVQIAGDKFGFQKVHDKLVGLDNPASLRQSEKLKSGVHYTSLVEVRNDVVRGFLNGQLIREWKTDFSEMSPSPYWRLRDTSLLGVGGEGKPVFHRIEVREVTGKGRFTRGAAATNITAPAIQYSTPIYTNAVGAEMVAIPPGQFMLGSTKEEREWAVMPGNMGSRSSALKRVSLEGERQPRQARVHTSFWMGRTEVTVGQWRKFVDATGYPTTAEIKGVATAHGGSGPGLGQIRGASWRKLGFSSPIQDNHPVACVSWEDATEFCKWLTEREQAAGRLPSGCVMRLPTEAEWEYACRGGKHGTRFWWGDTKEDGKDRLNWSKTSDADDGLMVVDRFGERGRNGFGLADMAGNVWEWCLDNLDPAGAHAELYTDLSSMRVLKGGAFDCMPLATRCASREGRPADTADFRYGFRVCCGMDVLGGDPFAREVAALPAEQQVARVVEELKKRNPGYDGMKRHKIQDEKVIELELWTEHISDISPIRALLSLQHFYCTGPTDQNFRPTGKKGMLADLSPLKGMHLTRFKCRYNHIADFSPLAGMALTSLESQSNAPVCDLSLLGQMPLRWLKFDESLLKQGRNREVLRGIKTLERINDLSVAEFWKRVEASEKP